jgi:hypothetical protein
MKPFLSIVLFSTIVGVGLGSALGYIEARLPAKIVTAADKPAHASEVKLGPVAQVPETTFNFDRIERGTSMKHKFKIRNAGDLPLKLEVLTTTCKCTVGDLQNNEIGPGEETDVELEWTAKTPPGPFRHGATLSSNDPKQSRIELVVEGDVVESNTLMPPDLLFNTVKTNSTKEAVSYLVSNLEDEVQVTKYEFSDPEVAKQIQLNVTPLEGNELPESARSGVKITAAYTASKSIGPFFTWLTLETNLKNASKLTLPVTGNVVGDISIFHPGWSPQQGVLRVGPVSSKEGKKLQVNVAIRGEHAQDTELEVASVDPEELKVSLGEPKKMGDLLVHYPLSIEIPVGTKPMVRMARPGEEADSPHGDGVIVLKSTHPDTTEVRLLVRFSVE